MYQYIHAVCISATIATLLALSPLSGASPSHFYSASGTAVADAVNAQTVIRSNDDAGAAVESDASGQPDAFQRDDIALYSPVRGISPKVKPVYLAQYFLGASAAAAMSKAEVCMNCKHAGNSAAIVPEPVSMALVGIGLVAIYWLGRKRRKQSTEPRS